MSTSVTTLPTKYDVFLSFRGLDTRSNFITFLYNALVLKNIRTFKDDKELERGQRISPELSRAIKESKFAVVVISAKYAASTWCLEELVKIMELEDKGSLTVIPIFYGVDPCDVRWQIGEVAAQFKKHVAREDHESVVTWRKALTGLANISGDCSLKWGDDLKMIDEIVKRIWRSTETPTGNGSDIVGIDEHMEAISRLFDLNSKESVRMVGIWARGGSCRSALSKFVYQKICQHFQSHCFLGNLKRISQDHHMPHLREEFLMRVQGECLTRSRFENQKVLLVADDVTKLDQLDALAEDFNCFGRGSLVIVSTQDRQLLKSYKIKPVYEEARLRFQKLFKQLSSRKKDISAAGSGSFLRDDEANLQNSDQGVRVNSASFTPKKFDVFLSFGGADTRRNFISFLYKDLEAKEIRTFKNDKELVSGHPIPPELIQAIKGSKIALVVVSANYLSSCWFLEELMLILKLEKKGLLKVLPVFYEVEPSHVRRQIGEVKKHEKTESKERVKSWREGLTYLTLLSGECSRNWEDDVKLVDGITKKISKMLSDEKPTNCNNLVDNYLIGIDEHMNELYSSLDLTSSKGVQVIGIWGRGSVGRSAVARHVYQSISHNFEAHCFLKDVRRISLHCGESRLQEELLSKMQGEGLSVTISHSLRNKKILLVADDVDKIEQLDALAEEFFWFGPGSRIIITTQDRQLLSSSGVKSVYEADLSRCHEFRQLFRSVAFKKRDEPVEVKDEQVLQRIFNCFG